MTKSRTPKRLRAAALALSATLLVISTGMGQARFVDEARLSTTVTSRWGMMTLRYDMSAPACDATQPITLGTGGDVDGQIAWGDGTYEPITQYPSHTYPSAGVFDVDVRGSFTSFNSQNVGNNACLTRVSQWTGTGTTDLERAFWKATNLVEVAEIPPNVYTMYSMFNGATSFNQDINHWDVSTVRSMGNMFYGATAYNKPMDKWDVSQVTALNGMFWGADAFNQNIDGWDVRNVINAEGVFQKTKTFNQPLNSWRLDNAVRTWGMFEHAAAFNQPLNNWTLPKVKEVDYMFGAALSFRQDLSMWDLRRPITRLGFINDSTGQLNGGMPSSWWPRFS